MPGWEEYDPAPIEVFYHNAMKRFHEVKKIDHSKVEKAFGGVRMGTIDGITFNKLLAEFKVEVMKEYGITSDAIRKV